MDAGKTDTKLTSLEADVAALVEDCGMELLLTLKAIADEADVDVRLTIEASPNADTAAIDFGFKPASLPATAID